MPANSVSLIRSTLLAAVVAGALLATVVLPAEYGVDVTGVGRVLGLTQMGVIKQELAKAEASADSAIVAAAAGGSAAVVAATDAITKRDSMLIVLRPTQRTEVKLAMRKDQRASFSWHADSGTVYYNLHGEGPSAPGDSAHSYGRGTLRAAEGDIVALFDGMHGWFLYNPSDREVRVSLSAWGQFQELKRM
ncbi:MAG: transmembrane anchor protein [Phycisphaerae bacterium]|nr:transmembrane anchor protein [Gemmatimonadaceae bacterium]